MHVLLEEGQILAARALCLFQAAIHPDDRQPLRLAVQLNASPNLHPLLKNDVPLASCPAGFPQPEQFNGALQSAGAGCWQEAADRFAVLAEKVPASPPLWQNLGMLRAWVADAEGAAEAWHRYAALDVPLEDAVEAEALSRLLSDDPLGDQTELLAVTYPLDEARAGSDGTVGLGAGGADSHRSRGVCRGGDTATAGRLRGLGSADAGCRARAGVGAGPLFRQPADALRPRDRPAGPAGIGRRLGGAVAAGPRGACRVGAGDPTGRGDEPGPRPGFGLPAAPPPQRRVARGLSEEQMRAITVRLGEDAVLNGWTRLPLGLLGGRTPAEAAPIRPSASRCWRRSSSSSIGPSRPVGGSTSTVCAARWDFPPWGPSTQARPTSKRSRWSVWRGWRPHGFRIRNCSTRGTARFCSAFRRRWSAWPRP